LIESNLHPRHFCVKTPRVVIRDDGRLTKEMKSRFYHIYNDPEVKGDINREAEPHEPLPDLVTNAYYYLGLDWQAWFFSVTNAMEETFLALKNLRRVKTAKSASNNAIS
jgi:hypothetical protein